MLHVYREEKMSRIEKIKKYKELQDSEKIKQAEEEKIRAEQLKSQIRDLQPRISELIKTANACFSNNIKIGVDTRPDRSSDTYQKGIFVSNGISHRVGFIRPELGQFISTVGFVAGGWDGPWDFRTDGYGIYSVDHETNKKVAPPLSSHMQKFIDAFDIFETAFYSYVDSIVG